MQHEPKSPSPERATVAGGFEAAGGSPEQIAYENAEAALDAITVFENGDSARIDATVAAYVHEANLSPTAEEVDKEQAAAVGVLEAVGDEGAVETVHALNGVSVETLGGSLAVVAHGHEADEIKGLMARMDQALAESGHGHTKTPDDDSLPDKFTPILDITSQQLAGSGHQRPIPVDMPPGFNTLSRDVNEQSHRYTSERLQKQPDVRDDNGCPRPIYEINGHTVTFRNRQEVVVIGDLPTVPITGGDLPLELRKASYADALSYSTERGSSNRSDVISVTNTPAGILEAAATLSRSPEAKEHLVALLENAQSGHYACAEMLDVIDGILGAVSIDDEGRPLGAYDTDGYAVALAALSGDEVAQGVVQMKRTALRDIEQATQERRMRAAYERSGDVEPIPVDQVCVVHATKYGIKRDEYGNIFLRPAAQERSDQFPRASVHFTLNSRVESHAMGAWDDTNRMIVARLDKTMEASKTRPRVLESVDTWFINGPGEVTVLPDAVVVEPQADLVEPIVDDGNGMIYFRSGESSVFNDVEQSELTQMANRLGVSDNDISRLPDTSALAREVALRMAMQQQGIDVVRYADIPSSDGIKTGNQRLSEGVWSLAHRLGVESGLHMGRPEERLESEANRILHAVDRSDAVMQSADAPIIDADLRARRQELVSGYLRATPAKVHETTVHF